MSPGTFVVLSGTLTFGVPLALALYELLALRRPPSGGSGGHTIPVPPPQKPLPDCLIPRPMAKRRVLEDA